MQLDLPWQTILLVLSVVAGIKRHDPKLKGWKTLLAALVASLALTYDYPLPAYLVPLKTGLLVFAVAVGGHSYVIRLAGKLGVKLPEPIDWPEETPTKPERKVSTIPPKGLDQ